MYYPSINLCWGQLSQSSPEWPPPPNGRRRLGGLGNTVHRSIRPEIVYVLPAKGWYPSRRAVDQSVLIQFE